MPQRVALSSVEEGTDATLFLDLVDPFVREAETIVEIRDASDTTLASGLCAHLLCLQKLAWGQTNGEFFDPIEMASESKVLPVRVGWESPAGYRLFEAS